MQERLTLTIPTSNKWHTEDLEKKAESLGMTKGEFLLEAVNMMMSFDEEVIRHLESMTEGLHLPLWLVMQNMIIRRMAEKDAEYEVGRTNILTEFAFKDNKVLTGKELFQVIKENYIFQFENEK